MKAMKAIFSGNNDQAADSRFSDHVKSFIAGGNQRPVVSEGERCEMLLGLRAIGSVAIFSEPTPLELIKKVKPDILCKGGDWPIDKIVGADFVQSYGGKVVSLPFVDGRSSSAIIEKIIKC